MKNIIYVDNLYLKMILECVGYKLLKNIMKD